jgi:HlyD family secretion protein
MLKKLENRPWYVPFPIPLAFPLIGLSVFGWNYYNQQQQTATAAKQAQLTAVVQPKTVTALCKETATNTEAQTGAIAEARAGLVNARIEDKRYTTLARAGAVSASSGDSKRLTLQTSQQKVNQAQANLNRITASGTQQIAEAKANLRRIQASGQQQILEAKANLSKIEAETKQQIREAQFTLNKIAEVRPVDVVAAETDIKSAIASLKVAEENLAKAYIKSPQDGQIYQIYARPGEVVGTDGIAEIGRTSQMEGVVEVYQSDVYKV